MPERFSWIIEGRLAGMERPGLFRKLEEDLEFLKKNKIEVIINLEEDYWEYSGFEVKHIPISDFKAPRLQEFDQFVEFVDSKIREGKGIAVHCYAGMGRTNLMIASYLIHYLGTDPDKALELVRERRPAYMVNQEQVESLREYFYTLTQEDPRI
jgi:atypical dual specificity phosphatase